LPALTLLTSPAAPIVLLEKAQVAGLCDQIAPGLAEVGVMLPSNPLQHLLRRRWRAHRDDLRQP
jgi:hydrogenase maturation protein HypF